MKKTAITLCTLLLLVSIFQLSGLASANPMVSLPEIVIKSDGSISPETNLIVKAGNTYSLTSDLSQTYAIAIQCNNIVFDGKGHFLNGFATNEGYSNWGLDLDNVSYVVVKNVQISGFGKADIYLNESIQCSISNVDVGYVLVSGGMNNQIANNTFGKLWLASSEGSTITQNNITDVLHLNNPKSNLFTRNNIYTIFFTNWEEGKDGNTFLENNFLCGEGESSNFFESIGTNFWDNGTVGNYWYDYLVKYPNASEIGNSGIGNSPYTIDQKNRDNYPHIMAYEISPSEPKSVTGPFPTILVVSSILAVAVVIGLFVYFKRFHRNKRQ
jgi:hypothetical protein